MGVYRVLRPGAGVAATLALFLAMPASAGDCRLALALALDNSSSVDSVEYALQVGGLAEALRDPQVQAAMLLHPGAVALSAFEWSGPTQQVTILDWSVLTEAAEVDAVADRIAGHGRTGLGKHTAVGSALSFGHGLLARGPRCARRVIDLSGDGYSNSGPSPDQVYRELDFSGITVNALVIGGLVRPELLQSFEVHVIRGPDAFAVATGSFADFAEAMRRKLLREITGSGVLAAAEPG